jgi:hypothetical protein
MVLILESTFAFSKRASALIETTALSASDCWLQPRSDLAARICRGVTICRKNRLWVTGRHLKGLKYPLKGDLGCLTSRNQSNALICVGYSEKLNSSLCKRVSN